MRASREGQEGEMCESLVFIYILYSFENTKSSFICQLNVKGDCQALNWHMGEGLMFYFLCFQTLQYHAEQIACFFRIRDIPHFD